MKTDSGTTKKIGVYGGSFNPFHNGHLRMSLALAELAGVNKVMLMPSNIPPHKAPDIQISAKDRLKMCRLATENDPLYAVSDIEIQRGGTSYTIDTLRELKRQNEEEVKLYLFMGSDMFMSFDTWREYSEIFEICTICVALRENKMLSEVLFEKAERLFGEQSEKILISSVPPFVISSSAIRDRIANGESIEKYVPEKVAAYIQKKGLYK